MRSSFRYADATLGINTSGMIDSILADKPTFSVIIADYAATQSDSKHFRHLRDAEALYLEADLSSFITRLSEIAAGVDAKAEQRRRFAQDFARPHRLERPAGDFIAERVLQSCKAAGG